jgi:DNA-binding response OmpR family regulator
MITAGASVFQITRERSIDMRQIDQLGAIRQTFLELAQAHATTTRYLNQLHELMKKYDAADALEKTALPWADEKSYCIIWHNRRCYLGSTKRFYIFSHLLVRANQFVSYANLRHDVWHGDMRSNETIRSAVRELRSKLIRARMRKLAIAIRTKRCHCGLIFWKD